MWIDVRESEPPALHNYSLVETPRPSRLPIEKNNGNTRWSRTREVSSRYRSPSPSVSSGLRRCTSPVAARTGMTSDDSVPKRAISAEGKRPSVPTLQSCRPSSPSSPSPSTPVQDASAKMVLASRKMIGNRLAEGLWPSTMRSLSVAFQSDSFSLPIGKREKPVTNALSDRTLRPSSNIARKQGDTPPASRKPTPERNRSPLKGKNSIDQTENSRPVIGSKAPLVDQHRWPSRAGGKLASTVLPKSIDPSGKTSRTSLSTMHSGTGMASIRRLSLDGASKPLQKSVGGLSMLTSSKGIVREGSEAHSCDDNAVEKASAVRSQYFSVSGSRAPSPSKASLSSPLSRGVSPSQTKTTGTFPSRSPSPWVRPCTPSRQSNGKTSVLSFIVDVKKGKKAANHIEDAHQLRLLHNRHLQWRFTNAQAKTVMHSQKVEAEKTLHNIWRTCSGMLDSVMQKRSELQQLRLKLKLHLVLNEQMAYLNDWALIERDHTSSLSQLSQDLEACTLRLPITEGSRGNIQSVKSAVRSAAYVLEAMTSSVCSLLSRAEGMNCLVSELADIGAQQRAMLDECEALLASTAITQVKEYSLRTHLMQLRESLQKWSIANVSKFQAMSLPSWTQNSITKCIY